MDKKSKTTVGITERGDAGLDFSWKHKLSDHLFSILITKSVSDNFIEAVKDLDNVIIHATITGYGDTVVEPNVMPWYRSIIQVRWLIFSGFPAERVVIRIDPIFETEKGKNKVIDILDALLIIGVPVRRIRYSYLDLYPHVKQRFINANIPLPQLTNKNFMRELMPTYPQFIFESCAEGLETDVGCISAKDFELFGVDTDTKKINQQNRQHCKCLACKTELLAGKKRCPHGCLYCYWKD